MNYLVRFNFKQKKSNDGVEVYERIPIELKVTDVDSKLEALRVVKEKYPTYFQGNVNSNLVENLEFKRIPEDAPILKTSYFRLYQEIFKGFSERLKDGKEIQRKASNGNIVTISKERTGYDKDEIIIKISVGMTDMEYDFHKGSIRFNIRKSNSYPHIESYNESYAYFKPLDDEELIQRKYGSNQEEVREVKNFFETLPMFSRKELDKLQIPIQKKYEKDFLKKQLRIIAEDEELEKLIDPELDEIVAQGRKNKKRHSTRDRYKFIDEVR